MVDSLPSGLIVVRLFERCSVVCVLCARLLPGETPGKNRQLRLGNVLHARLLGCWHAKRSEEGGRFAPQ